ncbi:hypothetical protein HZH68_010393 [Vespula germanica]|uniref:Uncharacterized protein n=1 Tax=Vespula germanica TaxID=30212 RepID=A0A834N3F5_VESGE|nr:hypothetical protein HZH68_010393 [Vespula germanica]
MKRYGGDTVPLGGNIRRPPLTVGPVMPRISTIQISILAVRTLRKMKRRGGDTVPLGGNIRRPLLTVGPVMPRISIIHILKLAIRMLQKQKRRVNNQMVWSGPQMQQPPRGWTWVGSTCGILKSILGGRESNHRGIFTRKLMEPLGI